MPAVSSEPRNLRPFLFHGIGLEWKDEDGQATGDCPFCGREGKFSVRIETGQWDCKQCGVNGNPLTFLRQLHRASADAMPADGWDELAADRKLLYPETLMHWECCLSISEPGMWLVPGWDEERQLHTLYRRVHMKNPDGSWRWALLPTPGVWPDGKVHGLFGANQMSDECRGLMICEAPWDGMAAWEVHHGIKSGYDVVAVPSANVFQRAWCKLAHGREVVIAYDNDHPKVFNRGQKDERLQLGAGFVGTQMAAEVLLAVDPKDKSASVPASVGWLCWGGAGTSLMGHDPLLPTRYDVRDHLSPGASLADRVKLLEELLKRVVPVPEEWREKAKRRAAKKLIPLPCSRWSDLVGPQGWSHPRAFKWRRDLDDAFSVMMAVALSTPQQGTQIYLQVIGDPGSGKTTLCEGMLVSERCKVLDHATGFHSGYKDDKDGTKDFSLINRLNGKTVITPEGGLLMSNPKCDEVMDQMRRIFDGSSSSSYKNLDEEREYSGLRTPWIVAATPAFINQNQAKLGDRFLRVWLDQPPLTEKTAIIKRACHNALDAVLATSNGTAESVKSEALTRAFRLTGGYVDHLREHGPEMLSRVKVDREGVVRMGESLANFVADMRARPDVQLRKDQPEKETSPAKELPSRLAEQFCRLSVCLAAVLNRPTVDAEVMRRVAKVAMDTARGRVFKVCRAIHRAGVNGAFPLDLTLQLGEGTQRLNDLLWFLSKIDVIEHFTSGGVGLRTKPRWRLTRRMAALWDEVISLKGD